MTPNKPRIEFKYLNDNWLLISGNVCIFMKCIDRVGLGCNYVRV